MSTGKKDIDSVTGVLKELDHLVTTSREKFFRLQGEPPGETPSEQQNHKDKVQRLKDSFCTEEEKLLNLLEKETLRLRKKQPRIKSLTMEDFNRKKKLPRELAFGSLNVTYSECNAKNGSVIIPRTIPFPFPKSIYLDEDSQLTLLHLLLLKIIYTLPLGQVQLYIYDPNGLGKSVQPLNHLFHEKKLFPNQAILHNSEMLDKVMEKLINLVIHLRQNEFLDQQNWFDYNNFKYSKGQEDTMVPYQILVLLDTPDSFGSETFSNFRKLLQHGEDCGVLTIFSANKSVLESERADKDPLVLELKRAIKESLALRDFLSKSEEFSWCHSLTMKDVEEKTLPSDIYTEKTLQFKEAISQVDAGSVNFPALCQFYSLYDQNSQGGITVPIGFLDDMPVPMLLEFGDAPVHYALSGATGSGKSFFLHNFILSACCRYSPQELQLYLLDFKDGVEFNVYATAKLPHAKLVATEADPEYGASVLDHIAEEMSRRNRIFKEAGKEGKLIRNIHDYRKNYPDRVMPRILIVIDECQTLIENHPKARDTLKVLDTLLRKGRNTGIHFLFATQNVAELTSFEPLKGQVLGRITLKSTPNAEARNMGVNDYGDSLPYVEKYHGLTTDAFGASSRVRYFLIPDSEAFLQSTIQTLRVLSDTQKEYARFSSMIVYGGESLSPLPPEDKQASHFQSGDSLHFTLGLTREIHSQPMRLSIQPKSGENLRIVGSDKKIPIKRGLLQSLFLSAYHATQIETIVYVGEQIFPEWSNLGLKVFKSPSEFIQFRTRSDPSAPTFLILDNPDLTTLNGYKESSQKEEAGELFEFLQQGYEEGHMTALFLDNIDNIKTGIWKTKKEYFKHRLYYNQDSDKIQMGSQALSDYRVGYYYEDTQELSFFPYKSTSDGQ